jgi:predicted RNA binding protein YcfA (HicA-like mRNA interferase family)
LKRVDLVRLLAANGCLLQRHGGRHDIYCNPLNGCKQPVPRHSEIAESLARHIIRHLGVEEKSDAKEQ